MTKLKYYKNQYNSYKDDKDVWPYGISSGGVVYKYEGDKYYYLLLGRNSNVDYHLPKGTLHIGESLENCALREIKEEAGVTAELTTYLGGKNSNFEYKGQKYEKMLHYYAAELILDTDEMDNEHDFKIWCSYQEAVLKLQANLKSEGIFLDRCQQFLNG